MWSTTCACACWEEQACLSKARKHPTRLGRGGAVGCSCLPPHVRSAQPVPARCSRLQRAPAPAPAATPPRGNHEGSITIQTTSDQKRRATGNLNTGRGYHGAGGVHVLMRERTCKSECDRTRPRGRTAGSMQRRCRGDAEEKAALSKPKLHSEKRGCQARRIAGHMHAPG